MVDSAVDSRLDDEDAIDVRALLAPIAQRWRLLAVVTLIAGALGAAGSYLLTPVFTSTATFLPPLQQQSSAASALASLGALAGIAGGGTAGLKSPAEQYIGLMQSVTVSDRLIDRFKLLAVYDAKYRQEARKALAEHVLIAVGKKDGMISVAVEDTDPARAAAIANDYVEELRRMTSVLAVSEAQQRRVFFEHQVKETEARLVAAQVALQASGFDAAAMKAEPKAAADEYARLRAEWTSAQVRLETLRNSLTETAPQVQQQAATVRALRAGLDEIERTTGAQPSAPDYVGKYREFKYQETLFDLMARQYEIARVDESREGALIQVVDAAQPAELKTRPRRSLIAIGAALAALLLASAVIVLRARKTPAREDSVLAQHA